MATKSACVTTPSIPVFQSRHQLRINLTTAPLPFIYATYKAVSAVQETCWEDCDVNRPGAVQQLEDLGAIFRRLKESNIKIAVYSPVPRRSALKTLRHLNLAAAVDTVACTDDPGVARRTDWRQIHRCRMGFEITETRVISFIDVLNRYHYLLASPFSFPVGHTAIYIYAPPQGPVLRCDMRFTTREPHLF